MGRTKHIILLSFAILFIKFSWSQSNIGSHEINMQIPDVALLALAYDNSGNISFNANSPQEAGDAIDFSSINQQNSIWINYSSINKEINQSRKVVAFIQGEVPIGVHLSVEASGALGAGSGKLGISSGVIKLSDQPTEIITNIGSSYTGKGLNNGHSLKYSLEFDESSDNYNQILQAGTSFNVVYTLTDSN